MIRLLIFDVDGTLAQAYQLHLMPRVKEFFQRVVQGGCEQRPRLAIATNQGGVGMRYQMEQNKKRSAFMYPDQAHVEERLQTIVRQLGLTRDDIPIYVSFRYRDRQGVWTSVPPGKENDSRWLQDWRKPSPGMLLQAMADAGAAPNETLYIGDRKEDQAAARAAGCHFTHAKDFFQLDWSSCATLHELLFDHMVGGSTTEDA